MSLIHYSPPILFIYLLPLPCLCITSSNIHTNSHRVKLKPPFLLCLPSEIPSAENRKVLIELHENWRLGMWSLLLLRPLKDVFHMLNHCMLFCVSRGALFDPPPSGVWPLVLLGTAIMNLASTAGGVARMKINSATWTKTQNAGVYIVNRRKASCHSHHKRLIISRLSCCLFY